MIEGIKTVFVDVDDTLWWFSENSLMSLRHVYEVFKLDRFADYDAFDRYYHDINSRLWELYHYGKIEKSFLVEERFRYALEKIGFQPGTIGRLGVEINEEYLRYLALQPLLVPGARVMLEGLAPGYDINVLSNGFKGVQQQKLRSGGIDGYIRHVVLSDDCGITKPLRGIFDYALGVCGATAESSVMIGDNYDTDVCGAKNAGWHTIFFNRGGKSGDYPAADAVVEDLREVLSFL